MDLYSQYLMWMKSKHIFNSQYFQASSISTSFNNSSWEEQAFAEDAAGPLGGFIWPPRSYFCSFCKREFRSAQALGGHMNVHRKDRARLKQPLSDHDQNHSKTLGAQYPSQVCTSDSNPNFVAPHLSSSPSRVNSATSTLENVIEHTFFSSCPSSFAEESYKNSTYSPPWPPLSSTGSNGDEGVNRKRQKAAVSALEDLDLELRLGDPPNYIR